MGMVDVGEKPKVLRVATAKGEIFLKPSTIDAIRQGGIKKGDPICCAEIAGVLASKKTWELLPHCHQIPLDSVSLSFELKEDKIVVSCTAKAHWSTGVEMEALIGVSIALNTIWDMVKYLEKDSDGQYPHTSISNIVVLSKEKGANFES